MGGSHQGQYTVPPGPMPAPVLCLAAATRIDVVEQRQSGPAKKPFGSIAGSFGQGITQLTLAKRDHTHEGVNEL